MIEYCADCNGEVAVKVEDCPCRKELEETIQLLESEIPANPASEKNEKLEKRMQKSIAEYFRNVDQAVGWNALEAIYYRNVKQE
jgi:protein involved in sex pheromone biosynthesis